jgi:hypothetical protein
MGDTPLWARPEGVYAITFGYLLLHFLLRMAFGEVLGIDDAEQALFAQQFEWSYRYRAPPLFTWILLALQNFMDPGILPISLIRYALLAGIYLFTYWTARLLIEDQRLSALATYGLATVYVYGVYSHHDLTHTTMLAVGLAIAWYAAIRIKRSPSWQWYALLGLASAIGLLGKWNFVIFLVAVLVVAIANPDLRRSVVFKPQFLVAAGILLIFTVPTVYSTIYWSGETNDSVANAIGAQDGFLVANLLGALAKALGIFIVYPLPFAILAIACFWPSLDRHFLTPVSAASRAASSDIALMFRVMIVASVIFLAIVLAFGAGAVTERMLQPALYPITILFFALIAERKPGDKQIRYMASWVAVVVTISFIARIATFAAEPFSCDTCRTHIPVADLAEELKQAGFDRHGTIVVEDHHLGGNLRAQFPEARIADLEQSFRFWSEPSMTDGNCVFVQKLKNGRTIKPGTWADFESFLTDTLSGKPKEFYKEQITDLRMPGLSDRTMRYAYRVYENGNGECR